MQSRIRTGLAAGAAAVAVFVMAAAPSSALPPPGDDGESPIDRPPPTRPSTTTTTATPPAPRVLNDLTVTTDSVVATATVRYDGTPGLVTIDWGDGTVESRNPADPTDSPFPDPWTPSDPPGIGVFKHAYAAPANGARFTATITARIGAESQARAVFVTPRYRVTQHQATVTPLYACDTSYEAESEWEVIRRGGDLPDESWEFDVEEYDWWEGKDTGELPYDGYPQIPVGLADSVVSFDLAAGDEMRISYEVTELDPLIDNLGDIRDIDLDPQLGSRSVFLFYGDVGTGLGGDCSASLEAEIDVRLLTPGLSGGPVAGQ